MKKVKNKNRFYVYIYLDPRKPGKYVYGKFIFDFEPFYVGKGSKWRMTTHLYDKQHNKNKITIIRDIKKELNADPIIFKIKSNMTNSEAYKFETKCVKSIGRQNINSGPLTNHNDAGMGGGGHVCSETTKRKIGDANRGRHKSKETIRKLRMANIGKKPSKTTRRKISVALRKKYKNIDHYNLGRKVSKKTRQKMSRAQSGKKHPNYGKKIPKKTIQKAIKTRRKNRSGIKIFKTTNPAGKIFYTTRGLRRFCKKHKLFESNMQKVANGKQKHHRGWLCERLNQPSRANSV